jgi:hypothetical protein
MAKDYIRENLNKVRQLMKEDIHDDMEEIIAMVQDEKSDDEDEREVDIQPGDDIEDEEIEDIKDPDGEKDVLETIPYSTNDELLSSITQTCKERFGANFTKSKTPMLYYPKDGDVTLTGEISSLNNAVFQFRYKDATGNGCYVWIEPVHISDETIKVLNIVNGVYKNWKNDLATSEDIKPMSMRNEGILGGEPEPAADVTPGDDLD